MRHARTIPSVIFSQHPDHAGKPFWHTGTFIETRDELKECYLMWKKLGAQEMMWDWEGKLVDEAVIERLLGEHLAFFKKRQLGRDIFLTFRVPNPRVESGYRLGRAFMVMLSAQETTKKAGISSTPLFEVILPMTENASELISLHKSFERFAKAASYSFGKRSPMTRPLEVIPLFESVDTILHSGDIMRQYCGRYKKLYGKNPSYLRPFCARSDPALNSGIVATTLAVKWALSEFARFSKETGVKTYPIIAPGSLPFRGGLTPETVDEFLEEFSGMRTIMIQSAFRYDYPLPQVKKAVSRIIRNASLLSTNLLSLKDKDDIARMIPWFEAPYRETVRALAPFVQVIAKDIPPRRERLQHIGLFGYSRGMGSLRLPRAIGFTASCYSLGIPPEFFGIGKGIQRAMKEGKLRALEALYHTLRPSLLRAGRFLRKESLTELCLSTLEKEIAFLEEYVGEELGPKTKGEKEHVRLSGRIVASLKTKKDISKEVEQTALLRRAIG